MQFRRENHEILFMEPIENADVWRLGDYMRARERVIARPMRVLPAAIACRPKM
jgi:hypothetical protein